MSAEQVNIWKVGVVVYFKFIPVSERFEVSSKLKQTFSTLLRSLMALRSFEIVGNNITRYTKCRPRRPEFLSSHYLERLKKNMIMVYLGSK